MKAIFILSIVIFSCLLQAQYHVKMQWESESIFKIPESIVYDEINDCLYVSNINGNSGAKDGNGFISKVGINGKIIELKWVTGLNAPKGSAVLDGKLYVSDVNELVIIDIAKQKIVDRIKIKEAIFLNDVAADIDGNIYVSDYSGDNSAIYKYAGENFEKWLDDIIVDRPNGLFASSGNLYIGNTGTGQILAANLNDKSITSVAVIGSGIDGLFEIDKTKYLVSDWAGKTSLVMEDGKIIELINTTENGINSADFCYIPKQNLLIIPTFKDNRIVTYKLIEE